MNKSKRQLIVIAGPTASGKTALAIRLAQFFQTEIISTDSRQFYREMKIGTAAPSEEELLAAPHHFIGNLSIHDYYNVSLYEQQALEKLNQLFKNKSIAIAVGGSGMYIDALCHGIDDLPNADENIRANLIAEFEKQGITFLQEEVKRLDPDFYSVVDSKNPKRLQRALEVIYATGKTYSSQRTQSKKIRDFEIQYFFIEPERSSLYKRIDARVDQMIENGLIDEAKKLFEYRSLNALNTVGYKELFSFMEGKISLDQAIIDIKTHSRRYAKRQFTWFKRFDEYQWHSPSEIEKIILAQFSSKMDFLT
jgi:tRNA dimethylallyltransferase